MKIGVITSVYPEFMGDPHGIFVHRLMREITRKGYDVKILAPFSGGKTGYSLEGVEVEKFNYFYPRKFQKLCGRSGMIDNVKEGIFVKFQFLTFIFFNVFYSLRKLNDADIIHVQWPIPNGLGALFLKIFYGLVFINTVHGEEIYLSRRYHTTFILRFLVNSSFKTVTNSSGTYNAGIESGLKKEKLEIIPFAVDTNYFKPNNNPKKNDIFQILGVGYLIERKGFEYLIKAVKEVVDRGRNVQLIIVGSGPLEGRLREMIKKLKLEGNAEIKSNVSDEKLLELYNTSDTFVLPSVVDSQGNTEGLGVVLLEAMACKLPVIGSNVGGIPDIIQNNITGILVQEKSSSELSKAIIMLMDDDGLRNDLALKGYKITKEQFSWEKVAEDYIKIYKSALKNKQED